jgi:hypothetical protein
MKALAKALCGAIALFAIGCGNSSGGAMDATTAISPTVKGVVAFADADSAEEESRVVKWGIARKASASIQLGAFVPYCEGNKSKPKIVKVEKKGRLWRKILTLVVRFPKGSSGNCVGYGLGLTRWVRLGSDWREYSIFDGSTSPPSLRHQKQSS